jgi:hypothetical protein
MVNGYYFRLPSSEVKKVMRQSALMFIVIIIGLAIVTGKNYTDTAIFVVLLHVGAYFVLRHYRYVYVSSLGIRGESPLGSSKTFSWSDELDIHQKYNGIHGYSIQRKGLLDAIFVPKAILESPSISQCCCRIRTSQSCITHACIAALTTRCRRRAGAAILFSTAMLSARLSGKRVCRAWHVTMSVGVRQPGFRRAEG